MQKFMQAAIEKAREGVYKGQTPFGACIVKESQIICTAHNIVWDTCDITAHAEINAIRQACKKLNSVNLSGCTIYSTCEPCPMCFSAIHWAGIKKIVYGANISDAKNFGFSELTINNFQMKDLGQSHIKIIPDFMRDENVRLFQEWSARSDRKTY